jgi:acetate kinase
MNRSVLVLNAGSSSLKYRVVTDTDDEVVGGRLERLDETGWGSAFDTLREALDRAGVAPDHLLAAGHRVVHGGGRYRTAVVVGEEVEQGIEELVALAPLHNPPALAGIRATRDAFPELPQVAVFDTAFFADLPPAAATYALDRSLAVRAGIRRYGFHGISHEYVAAEAARVLGRPLSELRLIVLHLGNGASASAIRGGRPLDTSMGMTPLEGLVMGTRSGDIDPGVLFFLLRQGHSVDDVEDLLLHRAGLEGLTGMHDFRDLAPAVAAGDEVARAGYDVYCHRLRKYVGAYVAVLGGVDAVVFTAGVGERAPEVREDAMEGLSVLGIEVDPARNRSSDTGARRISTDASPVQVLVVPTDEEVSIARQARRLLA